MNPQDETRLRDMLDAARQACSFVDGKTRADLEAANYLTGFAVVRAIEIIGEAASNVSAETRKRYSDLPWRAIIGTRNRVVHAYNRVDYDIVWDIVTIQLPLLIAQLESLLPPETDASLPD
jgi:uncharacterized protein with HEPN domain